MPDLEVSADIDAFMQSATNAAARSNLGLGALATITPGTGISAALQINVGSAGAPVLFNGALGTPSSGTLTNCTIPVGQITGAGTGVLTALAVNVGSAGAVVVQNGALGTPSSGVATNLTGTAAGLTAGSASAVAIGGVTGLGTGVATALAVNVGSAGAVVVLNGDAGTPSALVGTNITGTAAGLTAGTASAVAVGGITGLGTGVATFLATPSSANLRAAVTDESGTGALLFAGGALGTPASGVGTNFTGIPISTGLTGAGTGVLAALAVNANASGGLIILTDPGADRIPFWDDSAGAYVFLTVGSGLSITGTTLTATGGGSGDVVGPASSTDSVPAMFDGTTGKLLKNSTPTGTGNPVLATGPTISGATLSGTTTASTVNAGTANITTFKVLDAVDQSHGLTFVVSSDLSADKTFTYTGAFNYTMTLTGDTSVTFPTSGTLVATGSFGTGVLTQLGLAADGSDVDAIGFRGIPQNAQTGNYTCVMSDAGKCIFHASGAGAGDTYTIPANSSVAFEVGTVIKFKNMDSNSVAIAITTDTMTFLPAGTTGSRTLAQYGEAYAEKISSTAWTITGNSALT